MNRSTPKTEPHVRSLIGMNTLGTVLDEAALREEGRFWNRKKTRTVTTVTRKRKYHGSICYKNINMRLRAI